MGKKSEFFSKLFGQSKEFIDNTLESIGLDENDPKAKKTLAFLFWNDTIEWYCDECDERLDTQPGFSRLYRTYTCKACGHKNVLDPDNVYWNFKK